MPGVLIIEGYGPKPLVCLVFRIDEPAGGRQTVPVLTSWELTSLRFRQPRPADHWQLEAQYLSNRRGTLEVLACRCYGTMGKSCSGEIICAEHKI